MLTLTPPPAAEADGSPTPRIVCEAHALVYIASGQMLNWSIISAEMEMASTLVPETRQPIEYDVPEVATFVDEADVSPDLDRGWDFGELGALSRSLRGGDTSDMLDL